MDDERVVLIVGADAAHHAVHAVDAQRLAPLPAGRVQTQVEQLKHNDIRHTVQD